MNNTIPKVLHYVWFGKKELPALEKKCIETWKITNPDFEIKEWNEYNVDINDEVFLNALRKEEWAFCSDYARFKIISEHGGVYLDTDVEVVKDISPLLENVFFAGKENDLFINAAVFGAIKNNQFVRAVFDEIKLSMINDYVPIPRIMTKVYNEKFIGDEDLTIYDSDYFYPYNPFENEVKLLFHSDVKNSTYAIHHWNYSWKPSLIKRIIRKMKRIFKKSKYFGG